MFLIKKKPHADRSSNDRHKGTPPVKPIGRAPVSRGRRGRTAPPGAGSATYVLVAVGAGQVERRVAVVVLHVGAGLVVQQQQLPKERRAW